MTKASAFGAYGNTLMEKGKLDDSKANLAEAVALSMSAVGSEHPSTLDHLSDLAVLHLKLREFHTAARIGDEVLGSRVKTLGEEHHETISSMSDQATYLFLVGQRNQSKALIGRAVELARRHLGTRDPGRSSIISNAAAMYRALGQYCLSSELSLESFDSARHVKGEDSPETLSAMMEYSRSVVHNGELQTGREIMKLCVQRTKRRLGSDHELTIGRAKELADLYI